jgi:3-hydroxyisobutyrate dehydrogenase
MAMAKAEPGKTRIGWIGTGVMGRWMCQHLISKGYSATVYNRSRDKAQPLIDLGAAVADSPKAVAERSVPEGRSRSLPRLDRRPRWE